MIVQVPGLVQLSLLRSGEGEGEAAERAAELVGPPSVPCPQGSTQVQQARPPPQPHLARLLVLEAPLVRLIQLSAVCLRSAGDGGACKGCLSLSKAWGKTAKP